jgi:hypothetical protein
MSVTPSTARLWTKHKPHISIKNSSSFDELLFFYGLKLGRTNQADRAAIISRKVVEIKEIRI